MNETKGRQVSQSDQYGGSVGKWHSERSAKNAQECNQSQTGVKPWFVLQEAPKTSVTKAPGRTFY